MDYDLDDSGIVVPPTPGLMSNLEHFMDTHGIPEPGEQNLERDHGEYFSTSQAARELGVDRSTVHAMRKRGVLLGYRVRRPKRRDSRAHPWWFYRKEDVWALKMDPEYTERSRRAKMSRVKGIGGE